MSLLLVVGCGDAEPGEIGGTGSAPEIGVTGQPGPGPVRPGEPGPGEPNADDPGAGEPGAGGSGPGDSDSGNGSGDPGDPTPSGDPDPGDPEDPEVAWVPPGPGNFPGGPLPGDQVDQPSQADRRWSRAFQARDCDRIAALGPERDQRPLYDGLGAACRAVLRDDHQAWSEAEAAVQRVGDPTACLDRLALRLLRDLVAAHQRAPQAEIRIVDPPPGERCGAGGSSVTPTPTPPPPAPPSTGPGVPDPAAPPTTPSAP